MRSITRDMDFRRCWYSRRLQMVQEAVRLPRTLHRNGKRELRHTLRGAASE